MVSKAHILHGIFAAILALALLQPFAVRAQATSESQLKAAFLISFMKYVEWPAGPSALTICLRGHDPVFPYLVSYQGRNIGGRPLEIRRLTDGDTISGCHQLYLSEIDFERSRAWLQQAVRQPMLVSGEGAQFLAAGGSVALVRNDGRFQFDINIAALQRAGLKVGTPMLRLARHTVAGEAGQR